MTLPQLKKLVDEYHVFGTSLTRVRGHEILKELAGSFPSLYAALVDMHETLTKIENCMLDGKYEMVGAEGVIAGNITRANLTLEKHAALFNETKETK